MAPIDDSNTLRIGIVPDVHNGAGTDGAVERFLDDVVRRFNEEFKPDYTVVMGDLIEDTGSKWTDIELIREVKSVLNETDSPVQYLAGNHDPVTLSTAELETVLGTDMYRSATVGERTLVFLDSSAPWLDDPRGEVDAPQLTWLDETLRTADASYIFVHHPIHYCDLSDNYWFATTPERAFCGNKVALNDIINDHPEVKAVFNGHIHETRHDTHRGTDYISINAFNKVRPEMSVTGTHAEVTIQNRTMHVTLLERCKPVREFTVTV